MVYDSSLANALSGLYAVLARHEDRLYPEEIRTLQAAADILHKLERSQ